MLKLLTIALFLSNAHAAVEKITGAGATFPYPLYSKWFAEYRKINPNIEFNYQSIGSGGGVKQVQAQTVDFGASDNPMSQSDLEKAKVPVYQFPSALGGIAIAYNHNKIPNHFKISGKILADVFAGKINKWNDPELQKLNPSIKLPEDDILVIRRSDGSGTTANFTEYLSMSSPSWKETFGAGKSIRWKAGVGAKGNEGVTALISQIEGALGYTELAYAINAELQVMSVQNQKGEFVEPTTQSISKAGMALNFKSGKLTDPILNANVEGAYPISSYTYILIPKKSDNNKQLASFLNWAVHEGQEYSEKLLYSPLPKELRDLLTKELVKLQ